MANQRTTFGKRQREQNKKDKLKAKQERLVARRSENSGGGGPPIAWDQPGGVEGATDTENASDADTRTDPVAPPATTPTSPRR